MRGYTRHDARRTELCNVSPVHAGIYLAVGSDLCGSTRFPRSCGDIPHQIPSIVNHVAFPPFMRGYTRSGSRTKSSLSVSPVHAGIYLLFSRNAQTIVRFPRSCGDIPVAAGFYGKVFKFPPFMRGYTSDTLSNTIGNNVSPVHAGIYLD